MTFLEGMINCTLPYKICECNYICIDRVRSVSMYILSFIPRIAIPGGRHYWFHLCQWVNPSSERPHAFLKAPSGWHSRGLNPVFYGS